MSLRIQKNVSLAGAEAGRNRIHDIAAVPVRFRCGGRCGTINMSLFAFASKIGNPHEAVPVDDWRNYNLPLLDGAGKVSAIWYFSTPRGLVEVGDYWWNRENELSIRANDIRSQRWFLRWCKLHGIPTQYVRAPARKAPGTSMEISA